MVDELNLLEMNYHKVGPVITQPFTNHGIKGETFANRPIFHYMAIDRANAAHLAELDPKSAFVCRPSYDYWASIGDPLARSFYIMLDEAPIGYVRARFGLEVADKRHECLEETDKGHSWATHAKIGIREADKRHECLEAADIMHFSLDWRYQGQGLAKGALMGLLEAIGGQVDVVRFIVCPRNIAAIKLYEAIGATRRPFGAQLVYEYRPKK
jgi:ribosomal protein S18 acetylase RimI-like enzyme